MDRADAQNAALLSSVSEALDSTLATLNAQVLRTTTVDPETPAGGLVEFDLPKGLTLRDVVITISFGSETHEIRMDPNAPMETATAADLQPPPTSPAPMYPASVPASYAPAPPTSLLPVVSAQPPAISPISSTVAAAPSPASLEVAQSGPAPPTAIALARPGPAARAAKSTCIRILTDPSQNSC